MPEAAAPSVYARRGVALRRDGVLVALLALACLVPFLGKPFHIDDPMLLWAAKRIHADPLDFYGGDVNWHGIREPMAHANNNPPLSAYYVAAVTALVGWGERGTHAGMLLPAVALVLAVLLLAGHLCSSPRLAALAAWTMPAVVTSSSTLMADALLAALWCGALWLWLRGLERDGLATLALAGVVAALCTLTKYVGIALVPLLFVYTLVRRRRLGAWVLPLLIPVLALLACDLAMRLRYGHSPLAYVGGESLWARSRLGGFDPLRQTLVGLSFLGGCTLTALFLAPLLWSRRALLLWAGAWALATALLPLVGELARMPLRVSGTLAVGQIALFCIVAVQVFALAADDWRRTRSAESLLLALWLGGVFVFAAFLNWSVNARSMMPAVPAVALLLVRRLEARRGPGAGDVSAAALGLLAPALAVALAVAWADDRLALSARNAATDLAARYRREGSTLWFEGAWGFQLYMERAGARKVDFLRSTLEPGDIVVLPVAGSNVVPPPLDVATPVERRLEPAARWIATMSFPPIGAGFYSDLWGPLPFAVGRVPAERYEVFELRRRFRFDERAAPGAAVDPFAPFPGPAPR